MNPRTQIHRYLRAKLTTKQGRFRCIPAFVADLFRCPRCGADIVPVANEDYKRRWGCPQSLEHTKVIKTTWLVEEILKRIVIPGIKHPYIESRRLLFLIRQRQRWIDKLGLDTTAIDPSHEIRWMTRKNMAAVRKAVPT